MTKEMKEMRKKLIQDVLENWKHKKRMEDEYNQALVEMGYTLKEIN